jgi:uncharacterized protein (DUF2267 family)
MVSAWGFNPRRLKLDEGQIKQVKTVLPKEISSLYPQPDR